MIHTLTIHLHDDINRLRIAPARLKQVSNACDINLEVKLNIKHME
jgi:hypothetical protein